MQNPLNARQQVLIPVAALAVEGNIAALEQVFIDKQQDGTRV